MSFKFTQGGVEFDDGKLTLAYLQEFQAIIDEMSTFILNNPTIKINGESIDLSERLNGIESKHGEDINVVGSEGDYFTFRRAGDSVAVWYTYADEDGNPQPPIYMARIV